MEVEFDDSELERLALDLKYLGRRPASLVKKFRNRIHRIRQAMNSKDLYALRSSRLEKLKGKRKHQHSMRLNDQFRLIVEFRKRDSKELIAIIAIEDYH